MTTLDDLVHAIVDWCPHDHIVTVDAANDVTAWITAHLERAGVTVDPDAAAAEIARLNDRSWAV